MKRPVRAAVLALRDRLAPGGAVLGVRPLRGGVSSSVHSVRLEHADGTRRDVVVRTYGEEWGDDSAAVCSREFQLLDVLVRHGLAVPRPLLLDQDGAMFGAPTLVMSRVAGRGLLTPKRLDRYLQQLADALIEVHRIPMSEVGFLLPRPLRLERGPSTERSIEVELWAALRACASATDLPAPSSLVHGDYWPGNTVWQRERLQAVIDWEMAHLGDPARDVAVCRGDLAILFDVDTADNFTRRYERARGARLESLAFWNLYIVAGAMPYIEHWATGYAALGRADLAGPTALARLDEYARSLLRVQD